MVFHTVSFLDISLFLKGKELILEPYHLKRDAYSMLQVNQSQLFFFSKFFAVFSLELIVVWFLLFFHLRGGVCVCVRIHLVIEKRIIILHRCICMRVVNRLYVNF
jgi:hypothetical protein